MTDAIALPEINRNGHMLKALEMGDQCVVTVQTPQGATYRVVTIDRVTTTQIVADGKRYLISTGMEYGGSTPFHGTRLTPWLDIDEALQCAEAERLRKARNRLCQELGGMNYTRYYALTDEQLDTIAGWFELEGLGRDERETGDE